MPLAVESVTDRGPLYGPHYSFELVAGAALQSSWQPKDKAWIVRLIYDLPDQAVRPPLIMAFGDPDEPRVTVEGAFLEAMCAAWCGIIDCMAEDKWAPLDTGLGSIFSHPPSDSIFGEKIWTGISTADFDLLSMLSAVKFRIDAVDHLEHRLCRAPDQEDDSFQTALRLWRTGIRSGDLR